MGDRAVGECLLAAASLGEEKVRRRFDALPPEGKRERDVWLAIRQLAGEDIDELEGTRDFLQVSSWIALGDSRYLPYPRWTGVTDEETVVRSQAAAAEELLRLLREELDVGPGVRLR